MKNFQGVLKWLVTIKSAALAHVLPAQSMVNAVNVSHIIEKMAKYQDVYFPSQPKGHMTGLSRIYIRIIKEADTISYCIVLTISILDLCLSMQ